MIGDAERIEELQRRYDRLTLDVQRLVEERDALAEKANCYDWILQQKAFTFRTRSESMHGVSWISSEHLTDWIKSLQAGEYKQKIYELKVGSFYWVQIALDPDSEAEWENEPMPARYAGNDKWQFINMEGESNWPVRWVGPEITQ